MIQLATTWVVFRDQEGKSEKEDKNLKAIITVYYNIAKVCKEEVTCAAITHQRELPWLPLAPVVVEVPTMVAVEVVEIPKR